MRVNDDITVDLMTEACGVNYDEAATGIEIDTTYGELIPFAGPELLLKLKRSPREKDEIDRGFIRYVMEERNKRQKPPSS